ncbi:hypothetical protein C8R44DRAFT_753086 [Mycena epipterygia]|nr:hypothetical protein C8R44DRAFT_753086 [Mycena epipterygia]
MDRGSGERNWGSNKGYLMGGGKIPDACNPPRHRCTSTISLLLARWIFALLLDNFSHSTILWRYGPALYTTRSWAGQISRGMDALVNGAQNPKVIQAHVHANTPLTHYSGEIQRARIDSSQRRILHSRNGVDLAVREGIDLSPTVSDSRGTGDAGKRDTKNQVKAGRKRANSIHAARRVGSHTTSNEDNALVSDSWFLISERMADEVHERQEWVSWLDGDYAPAVRRRTAPKPGASSLADAATGARARRRGLRKTPGTALTRELRLRASPGKIETQRLRGFGVRGRVEAGEGWKTVGRVRQYGTGPGDDIPSADRRGRWAMPRDAARGWRRSGEWVEVKHVD